MRKNTGVAFFGLVSLIGLMLISCAVSVQSKKAIIKSSIIKEAKDYCLQNKMDTSIFIYVDMKIHSGKNRLFVYDFIKDSVMTKGLCAHGSCNGSTGPGYSEETPKFNNVPNSYCSSLGKYKIGKRAWSNWGINVHYKLHGLETSNSNAFKRVVVLHSYNRVENREVFPKYAITSWGCPMVSNEVMKKLDVLLKQHPNALLWINN